MKFIYYLIFHLTNQINIPYRWTRLATLYRKIRIFSASKLFKFIDKQAVLRPYLKISYFQEIRLGARSSLGDRNMVVAAGGLDIGSDVMIGPEVMIFTQNHQITPIGKKLINGDVITKPVVIEDDVWIGARSIILPGARIQKGTVIAAGAVVPGKTYPAYSVLGGNPAKVIKVRESMEEHDEKSRDNHT